MSVEICHIFGQAIPNFLLIIYYNMANLNKAQPTTRRFLYQFLIICNSYTMGCPSVRGDNPRALASGLSYVQVDKHGITILYHLHQCRPCTS